MTYQILKNGRKVKTIKASGMSSIYNQYNKYSKALGAVQQDCNTAIGMMVWKLPTGEVLALASV
jgi:hypothetical protein